jgi:hypothetical protein
MSPSRPIQPFDFQPEPIWWDGPFNPTLICPKILLNMYVKSVKSKKYAKIFDWEVYVEAHDVWSLGSTQVNYHLVQQKWILKECFRSADHHIEIVLHAYWVMNKDYNSQIFMLRSVLFKHPGNQTGK